MNTATPAIPPHAAIAPADSPEVAGVLSKAVTRAADRLKLSRVVLGRILGLSPATVSRLYTGKYQLDPKRKEWELALLLVRLFRSLDSLVGDEETARKWLRSANRTLNGQPIDLIEKTEGLVRVVHYLDAYRGLV